MPLYPLTAGELRHDKVKSLFEAIANDCGVVADAKPYGLFSPCIPSAATAENEDLHRPSSQQGAISDLILNYPANHGPGSQAIAELKLLSAGRTWYHGSQKAVDIRGRQLPKSYRVCAQKIDQKYSGTTPGQVGPMEQRLIEFGDLQCLVAGQFGEVSQHVHDLLGTLATYKAGHISRRDGRPVSDSERGLILHHLRRRLSVGIIRAQSVCMLARLGHMLPGAKDAARRRQISKHREVSNRKDFTAHWEAYVRGRRLHDIGRLHL